MLILPLFLCPLKFEIRLVVLSVLYLIGFFPLYEFKTAHLNSARGTFLSHLRVHKYTLKAKPEVDSESHTLIKGFFWFQSRIFTPPFRLMSCKGSCIHVAA